MHEHHSLILLFMKTPATFLSLLMLVLLLTQCEAERHSPKENDPPQLVVGIVVDQMRYDYIPRFWDQYREDGLKRLYSEGFSFDNANYRYVPTYTAPGHTSVFTGTTPAVHGIIGNNWFDKEVGEHIYCTDDHSMEPVGTDSDDGRMSPHRMNTTTITDELRLATNFKSRSVGVAIKDRSAIFPAGHTANGAYWMDSETGHFITSSWYYDELPGWVRQFNTESEERIGQYMAEGWDLLVDEAHYVWSREDDNPYEGPLPGGDKVTFPYDLEMKYESEGPGLIQYIPQGNDYTTDFAIAAIEGEQLGHGEATDFLTISYSSPDYVGHRFGPQSREIQDQYLRFDGDIARFLNYLEEEFGHENILVFLTADHGAAHVPLYMQDQGIPAGYFYDSEVEEELEAFTREVYGVNLIRAFSNQQVFLDHEQIEAQNLNVEEVENRIARYLRTVEGVAGTLTAKALNSSQFTEGMESLVQRGHHQIRSGDVVAWLDPQWVPFWRDKTGTTHFSPYSYDTRVPLLWYGGNIPSGSSARKVGIEDIAPTLGVMLGTAFPNGTTGEPLKELVE